MELANQLISLSLSDLKSSRILYESQEYRTSYFFFQQAAEKANKAFGLLQEIITEDDLHRIQHKPTKIHRKELAGQQDKIAKFSEAVKLLPKVENHKFIQQIDIEEYRRYLKDGLSYVDSLNSVDLVNISSYELSDFLRFLRKLEKDKEKLTSEKLTPSLKEKEALRTQMLSFADLIGAFGTEEANKAKIEMEAFFNDEEQWHPYAKALIEEATPLYADLMFVSTTFLVCAIITLQHSSLARYPDNKGNNPIDIYKKSLPAVKKQPEFMNFLEKALIKLNDIRT